MGELLININLIYKYSILISKCFISDFVNVDLEDDQEPLFPSSPVRVPTVTAWQRVTRSTRTWFAQRRGQINPFEPPNPNRYFGIGDQNDENVVTPN